MTQTVNVADITIDTDDLICPITLDLFHDPVRAQDGHVYERQAITQWIQEHGTSPFTRQPLEVDQLQPDEQLKSLAKQRRNSTVSYNVQKNLVTLPLRPLIKRIHMPNRIITMNRLKTCLFHSIYCKIGLVLLILGVIFGFIFGIMQTDRSPNNTTSSPTSSFDIITRYSSKLTINSSLFNRPNQVLKQYYYKAIPLMIPSTNYYRFRSISNIDMYGYLYTSNFNASNSQNSLLISNDDSGGFQQFLMSILLAVGNYTLVATTYSPNVTGNFSILVQGPTNITFY